MRVISVRNLVSLHRTRDLAKKHSWNETTLGEIVTLQRGFDLPIDQRSRGHFPVIASNGQVGMHAKAMVKGPGVVIGRSGFLGGGQYVESDFWPLNTTLWVKDFHGNDVRFCYYLLRSLDLAKFNAGSGVPTLNRNHIHPLRVRIPPITEQRKIAHVLGTIDDKIELNRRVNETLEAMASAIFKDWFVDFGPMRAKMEGRATYLPTELWDLFPDRLIESVIGRVPKGWEVCSLADLFEFNPMRQLRRGEIAPYLNMANMPTEGHFPQKLVDRPFGSGMKFKNGDTLLARITPCLENGKTAYVNFLQHEQVGWGSTEFLVMRSKSSLPTEFAYYLARSARFREFAIRRMTGTSGRQRVPRTALGQFLLPNPTNKITSAFGEQVRPLIGRVNSRARETHALAELRDVVLPRLVSGEVRIKDAESFLNTRM